MRNLNNHIVIYGRYSTYILYYRLDEIGVPELLTLRRYLPTYFDIILSCTVSLHQLTVHSLYSYRLIPPTLECRHL